MKTSVRIESLSQHIGQTVELKGWVSNKREGKGIAFVIVRDGSGYCQCVVTEESAGA
ncbi:MAG: OB-fold nucleic acid binding domain-containing protein, partial [Bacteroidia bacterium]